MTAIKVRQSLVDTLEKHGGVAHRLWLRVPQAESRVTIHKLRVSMLPQKTPGTLFQATTKKARGFASLKFWLSASLA